MNARNSGIALLATVFLSLGMSASFADEEAPKPRGEKIMLKLNLAKGETRKLHFLMDMDMAGNGGGQKMLMNLKMGMGMGVDVQDVGKDGLHTLKLTYDHMMMSMGGTVGDQPFPKMSYDTRTKKGTMPPEATAVFDAIVGGKLTMKVKPNGATTEVAGVEEFAERIAKASPGAGEAEIRQQVESMKNSFNQMAATYPDKPVDIRDSWDATIDMTSDPQMPLKMDAKYTLYDRQKGVAIVKVKGTMSSTTGLKGTIKGEMRVDEKSGWVTGGELIMSLGGTMKEVGGDVEMDLDGKITFSDKDAAEPAPSPAKKTPF